MSHNLKQRGICSKGRLEAVRNGTRVSKCGDCRMPNFLQQTMQQCMWWDTRGVQP